MTPAVAAGVYPGTESLKGVFMLHHCVTSNNFGALKFVIHLQNEACLYSTGDGRLLCSEPAMESEDGFLVIIYVARMSAVLIALMYIWMRNGRSVHQMKLLDHLLMSADNSL